MYACSTSSFSLTGVTGIVNSLVNHSSFSLTGVTDVPLLLNLLDSPTALISTPSVSDVSIHITACCSSRPVQLLHCFGWCQLLGFCRRDTLLVVVRTVPSTHE